MADILVPVGSHLFSADALNKVLNDTIPTIPPDKSGAIVSTVDADGVTVGVVVSSKDGKWRIRGAAQHTFSGDTKAGGSVVFSW